MADFRSKPEREQLAINEWIESLTESRIQDLLPEGSITPGTRLVLTNAVYFKGAWLRSFNVERTQTEVFHTPDGDVMVLSLLKMSLSS